MELMMHRFQPLLIHVRVNLRGRNIRVAEHLLDDAQVRAVPEQMRGEAMPQQMRINVRLKPRNARARPSRFARAATVVSSGRRGRKGKSRCRCGF